MGGLAIELFRRHARYNRWMNRRLYAAAATLDDAERRRDRGAFFASIDGTLNHLLLGDRLWLTFFEQDAHGPAVPAELRLPETTRLDAQLYADCDTMRAARERIDALFIDWLARLDDADLTAETIESGSDGRSLRSTLALDLQHVFNHQTHHRGQLSTLLMQAGIDPGVTDLCALPDGA